MKRIKTPQSQGRDYKKMLKDYFGKYLYGLDVREEGGRTQVQVIYFDYKHIDTVRRELTQMMPEVDFIKMKRMFTETAVVWIFDQMLHNYQDGQCPVIYVQRADTLVKTDLRQLAHTELNQMELEDGDIDYPADGNDLICCNNDTNLSDNALFD